MDAVEQTGRTVEDAVGAALKILGASRDEVEVEVLSEENRGILGSILGYSSARVRVTRKQATSPAPQADRDKAEAPHVEPKPRSVRPAQPEEPTGERSELASRAAEVADQILALMGLNAHAIITADNSEEVALDIHSDEDLGLLIGKHGQTLGALQLLVAMIANRQIAPEERRRVTVDAEGYRERRDRALQAMARSAAQRAKRSGRPVKISALTPRERRVIHVTLAEDSSVTTRSEGEDPDRSIIVTPRKRERYTR